GCPAAANRNRAVQAAISWRVRVIGGSPRGPGGRRAAAPGRLGRRGLSGKTNQRRETDTGVAAFYSVYRAEGGIAKEKRPRAVPKLSLSSGRGAGGVPPTPPRDNGGPGGG